MSKVKQNLNNYIIALGPTIAIFSNISKFSHYVCTAAFPHPIDSTQLLGKMETYANKQSSPHVIDSQQIPKLYLLLLTMQLSLRVRSHDIM